MKSFIITLLLLFFSFNLKSDWIPVSNGIPQLNINAMATMNGYIFVGTNVTFQGGGIFATTNFASSWYQVYSSTSVLALGSLGPNLFFGYNFGLGYSSNFGETWQSAGLNISIYRIVIHEDKIYACCRDSGLYVSTNNGVIWSHTSLNNKSVHDLTFNGSHIFAGLDVYGVYHSSNNGLDWIPTSLNFTTVWSIANKGNIIFAGGGGNGVFISTNNGMNWNQSSLNNATPKEILIYNNNIYEGGGGGIYVSTNDGINWIRKIEGMPYYVNSIIILNDFMYAGTDGYGVFRRPLSELTEIKKNEESIPLKSSLAQNYPNPFNPTTTIKFNIHKKSNVQIRVFDLLGNSEKYLVNQELHAGEYECEFNGSELSSGVYFYQFIENNIIIDTKKLVLVK